MLGIAIGLCLSDARYCVCFIHETRTTAALRGLKSVLGSILLTGEDSLDVLTLLYSFLSDLHWSMHELGNEVQLFPEEYHG